MWGILDDERDLTAAAQAITLACQVSRDMPGMLHSGRCALPTNRIARTLIGTAVVLLLVAAGCSSDGEGGAEGEAAVDAPAAAPSQPDSGLMVDAQVYAIKQEFPKDIELTSEVFNRIRRIPIVYTCVENYYYPETGEERYGEDKSPPLAWTNVPDGTASFAIIVDDPDAITLEKGIISPRVHWVIWNIPADVTALPEHVATTTEVAAIGPSVRQGANDYRGVGYGGPCPPPNVQAIHSNVQELRGITRQKPHKYVFTIYALDAELDLAAGANKNELLAAMDGHILAAGELSGEYVNKILYK